MKNGVLVEPRADRTYIVLRQWLVLPNPAFKRASQVAKLKIYFPLRQAGIDPSQTVRWELMSTHVCAVGIAQLAISLIEMIKVRLAKHRFIRSGIKPRLQLLKASALGKSE